MKYIITWVLITTFESNHSRFAVSIPKTIRQPQRIEISDRKLAFDYYNQFVRDYKSQFSDSTLTTMWCPPCWEYIDEVKIDSIP